MRRGEVFIEAMEVLTLESFPPQFNLYVSGNLPTPCHELRANVLPPDDQNRIMVDIYTVVDPEMMCIQVIEPFDQTIPLGPLDPGAYTVFVNGQQVGEISY